jgi:hypothetical protein
MVDYECDDDHCARHAMRFYDLIDHLIMDIQFLESKVVYLRYLLSTFLPIGDGEMLRDDIFRDLVGDYWDQAAYQEYMKEYYGGIDPMDSVEHNDFMMKLSKGEASANL